ncbi:hypothetical protein MED01_002298 [Micromonospora sp. MED01]|uniref:hypothetical protein n=1 Tax=Micromonospora alfalfae TaxID=2911212 RepID=UPI001EE7B5C1|nr:hypothetical protein [Micromonospora alfalfae]MCG5464135.1 hypothetical protein [Micromonospora alfalfae]
MTDPQHGSGRREPFWQTMAGMLTAIAALITAIVGAAAFVHQIGGFGADGGQQTSTGATSTPSIAPSSAGTTPTRPGPVDRAGAGPYEVLFANNGVDLDADPPKVATAPDPSIDIYYAGTLLQSYPAWSGLAKWDKPGAPQRQDCISQLNSFATSNSRFAKGSRYCVRT